MAEHSQLIGRRMVRVEDGPLLRGQGRFVDDLLALGPDLRAVLDVLAQEPIPGLGYAWICGEGSMVAAARRHLMRGQGLDRRRISHSGYWRLGRPRP